jgi:hypothetical protein
VKKIRPLRAKGVDPGEMLSEKVADGLTLGPEALEEAEERFPNLPGAPDLSYLGQESNEGIKFRALDHTDISNSALLRFPDGRLFRDVDIGLTASDRARVEQGYVCIRCLEPQSSANADDHLEGCIGVSMHGDRYMRDGQHLIDVAAEFDERQIHVGPSRPLRAFYERG